MERMEGDLEGRGGGVHGEGRGGDGMLLLWCLHERERERERGEYEGVMAAVVREKERRKRYGCYFLHGCMQLKVE
jgi:hypothetical protein